MGRGLVFFVFLTFVGACSRSAPLDHGATRPTVARDGADAAPSVRDASVSPPPRDATPPRLDATFTTPVHDGAAPADCWQLGDVRSCAWGRCTWFVGGCADETDPSFIYGPQCVPPLDTPCVSNADCTEHETCLGFWVDPCAGEDCDACGALERYCVVTLPSEQ